MDQVLHPTDDSIFRTPFTIIENFGGFFPAFHTHNVAVSIFLRSFFFFCMCVYAYLCLFFIEKFL